MTVEVPQSFIVDVNITRDDLANTVDVFSNVNIVGTSNVIRQDERIRFYSSQQDVGQDFLVTSDEYKAAEYFFSQNPRPQQVAISRRFTSDQPGFLIGNEVTALVSDFEPITSGDFNATIDGVSLDILGIDFTGVTNFSEIATKIQDALNTEAPPGFASATVEFINNRFRITSGTTGSTSTVDVLSAVSPPVGINISQPLLMNMNSGTEVDGTDFVSIVDEIQKIQNINDDWYWLTFTQEIRDYNQANSVLEVAAYIETQKKIYMTTSNVKETIDPNDTTNVASTMQSLNYSRTSVTYSTHGDQYPDIAIATKMAAVDFNASNSVITAAFQSLNAITAERISQNSLEVLLGRNANVFLVMGGRNVYFEGTVANGEYIDIINNTDWLSIDMQNTVFNLLVDAQTRIPFNDTGIQQVGNAMRRSLSRAVNNGMLSGEIDDDGNVIPPFRVILPRSFDIPAAQKASRILNGCQFTGGYSSAIHYGNINGFLTVDLSGGQ
jgi:hypothetical protein